MQLRGNNNSIALFMRSARATHLHILANVTTHRIDTCPQKCRLQSPTIITITILHSITVPNTQKKRYNDMCATQYHNL
jgi:hypothetical protein